MRIHMLLCLSLGLGCGGRSSESTPDASSSFDAEPGTPDAEPEGPKDPRLQLHLQGWRSLGWSEGQVGLPNEFWNQRVDGIPKAANSDRIIAYLALAEDCFNGDASICGDVVAPGATASELNWRIDMGKADNGEAYGSGVHIVDESTPLSEWTPRLASAGAPEDEFFEPHCDRIRMPIAENIRVQANSTNACGPTMDPVAEQGDCHYYAVNLDTGVVYEQWHAYGPGNPPGFDDNGTDLYSGGCTARFDLSEKQEGALRGLSCTSANAAGVSYVPFLVTPGEIKVGVIRHALAMTMYNHWIKPKEYVLWDGSSAAGGGTHNPPTTTTSNYAAPATSPVAPLPGWNEALHEQPPYGARFRLRGDFVIDPAWPPALRVMLVAMKEYGFFLIDGTFGGTFIATTNDFFDPAAWGDADVGLNPLDLEVLADLEWSDMEYVSGPNVGSMDTTSCTRTQINEF